MHVLMFLRSLHPPHPPISQISYRLLCILFPSFLIWHKHNGSICTSYQSSSFPPLSPCPSCSHSLSLSSSLSLVLSLPVCLSLLLSLPVLSLSFSLSLCRPFSLLSLSHPLYYG